MSIEARSGAIGKLMADYRRETTGVGSVLNDLVEPIAGLIRPTEVTLASIVQAAVCRRPNNQFFIISLPVLLTGTFPLSRFRPGQHG